MYYQHIIAEARKVIKEKHPEITPRYCDLSTWSASPAPSAYLLWMCDEVEKMDTSCLDKAVKAGRWIGWILCQMEVKGYWNNTKSRDLSRRDHENGFDLPHQK